jgi:PRTRC genetic system ThiF family protein
LRPDRQTGPASALDLSFVRAATVVTRRNALTRFVLVGCGGTGSWLAPSVARLVRVLNDSGCEAAATFIDPDRVEAKNIPRQNFCDAELGQPKALALAARYGAAWGVEIPAVTARFEKGMIRDDWGALTIIIGCVDNAAARRQLALTLGRNCRGEPARAWWLDCGNERESGQVLLGSAARPEDLREAFPAPTLCQSLPSPALQHPELLEPRPEELAPRSLSCAELALAGAQALMVNQRVAAEAADYLARLTLARNLRRFATYFDLESGSARSRYVTPESVMEFGKLPVGGNKKRR